MRRSDQAWERLATYTEDDPALAEAWWERNAPEMFKDLLEADDGDESDIQR